LFSIRGAEDFQRHGAVSDGGLYKGSQRLTYDIGYSARDAREGSEVMFFDDSLRASPLKGPFKTIRSRYMKRKQAQPDERPRAATSENFHVIRSCGLQADPSYC